MVPLEDVTVDPPTFMIDSHGHGWKVQFRPRFLYDMRIGLFLMILEDP
jgi:hypothetical protein